MSRPLPILPALLLAAALLVLPVLAQAAPRLTLSATPDTLISTGTVEVVIALTEGDGREPPNLTPLTRDFDIVGQGRRSRTEVVDGRRVPVNEWLVTLAPKRSGRLVIPAISLAGLSTAPVAVNVVPSTGGALTDERTLFVRLEAGDVQPFVQSDVPVTVRVYDRLGLRGGGISRISADGASFTPQGEQRAYYRTIGRYRYQVIEQSYLMRPQRSGTIEVPPVTLEAKVPAYTGGQLPPDIAGALGRPQPPNPWDTNFPSVRDLTVQSNPLTVTVRERPADAKGWFLPARSLTISSEWAKPPKDVKVGEVLTRTIRVEAEGAGPNQLPPLTLAEVPGVRQYEEQSRTESAPVRGAPGALLTKTVSVVPTRSGTFTLPAIELGWWNTATQRQETATLPAETFTVAADPRAPQTAAAPVAAAMSGTGGSARTPPPAVASDTSLLRSALGLWSVWRTWFVLAAEIALFCLFVAVVMAGLRRLERWRRGRRIALAAEAGDPANASIATLAQAEAALEAGCKARNAALAHRALMAWLRLSATGTQAPVPVTPALAQALTAVQDALYGTAPRPFDAKRLRAAFHAEQRARRKGARQERGARLAPLYPTAR